MNSSRQDGQGRLPAGPIGTWTSWPSAASTRSVFAPSLVQQQGQGRVLDHNWYCPVPPHAQHATCPEPWHLAHGFIHGNRARNRRMIVSSSIVHRRTPLSPLCRHLSTSTVGVGSDPSTVLCPCNPVDWVSFSLSQRKLEPIPKGHVFPMVLAFQSRNPTSNLAPSVHPALLGLLGPSIPNGCERL